MIFEINPIYDDVLVLDTEKHINTYYALFANRKNVIVDNTEVDEDDCLIAYSNESMEEIANHRSELVKKGYYKSIEMYIRRIPNFNFKKPKKTIGKPYVF
jgi:hypothetical protein